MAKTFDEQIQEAQAKGDTKEVERLTIGAGTISAATGLFTGIPDLVITGYNFATASNVKDLRSRILEAAGIPTQAPEGVDSLTYDLPEYLTMAWGLGSLAKSGWKGYKSLRENKKLKEFTNSLPPQQANRFNQFMMRGQGSDDPMVMAALQQLRKDPRYSELFTTLDKAATETAIKAMTPRPSRLSPQAATTKAVQSVEDKVNSVRKARDVAGEANFTRAAALAGDREIVNPSNTIQALSELRSRYAKVGTASSQKMVNAIDELSNTFVDAATGAPKNMTADQFKGLLTEFGRKVGTEDSVVKGLAQKDLEVLNNSVFSSLSKDLTGSLKSATNTEDKKAIGALIQARTQYAKGSAEYNKLISQGISKFLQNKSIDEVDPEMLVSEYKKLNPAQRGLFRDWLGDRSKESLQFIDKTSFDDFLGKSFKKLPNGEMGYDLGKMSQNWASLSANDKDILAKALGTNAQEFSGRMKDALVFSRKMDVGGITPEPASAGVVSRLSRVLPGAVGSTTAGYQGAKVTDLTLQAAEQIFSNKGLTSEQVMKALLTPEGADFLKQAALSPNSQKTLEALTGMTRTPLQAISRPYLAAGAVFGPDAQPTEPAMVAPTAEDDLIDPESPQGVAPMAEPIAAPQAAPMEEDDGLIDPDAGEPISMPQATNIPAQGFEQQMPMGSVPPEEEQAVMSVLQGMAANDPSLNIDRVMQSYMQADPTKRQQFMSLYGAQR
jgi:hypothetical protein